MAEQILQRNLRIEKRNTWIRFGETVDGYNIPMLNEREIRAAAGLLFLAMFISLMFVLFRGNFLPIKYLVIAFLTDLLIRVFINPAFSPTLILGRLIVGRQTPEYVAAGQKKFAWKIGIALATLMLVLLVVLNSYSILTGLGCLVCLVFLFFEAAFGICLGCLFYGFFYKDNMQLCAGDTCSPAAKQAIQKTSLVQLLIVMAFAGFIMAMIVLFNRQFSEAPKNLWEIVRLSTG